MPEIVTEATSIDQLFAVKRPAVFLDYDGTLTPIVSRPEQAKLGEAARAAVRRLAAQTTVAIVSGRGRADVEELVNVRGITIAGAHGFDVRLPDGRLVEPMEVRAAEAVIPVLAASLREELADVAGVIIEDKRFALAVHYRLAEPADLPRIEAAVRRAAAGTPELRQIHNKMVHELRPAVPWDKGRAVVWLMDMLNPEQEPILPIFIGDDETDRDAFRALKGLGLSFFVGEQASAGEVNFILSDTAAVTAFLNGVAAMLEGREKITR